MSVKIHPCGDSTSAPEFYGETVNLEQKRGRRLLRNRFIISSIKHLSRFCNNIEHIDRYIHF